VIVPSGSSFVDIAFPNHTAGTAAIKAAMAVTDGNSSLPGKTYYYVGTIVNEVGETQAIGGVQKMIAVGAGQRVDITFFTVSGRNWRRRLYRGTASGVYDGYFEMAIESYTTFHDSGQAFTARRAGTSAEGARGIEPDAVYAVAVSPGWNTTTWITSKSTGGFRVNFGTTPPAESTLDWIIIR